MDESFLREKVNILNFIKNENEEYLCINKKQTESFIENNKMNLDQNINNIDNELSEISLYNLDIKYNEMITNLFNEINIIIHNNNNLAVEYLSNVKKEGSSNCTQLFINKANIFFNSFSEIKYFIQLNLKNILSNKYKNAVSQIKNYLENISSNSIVRKYNTQLPFMENYLQKIENIFKRFNKYLSNEIYEKNIQKK